MPRVIRQFRLLALTLPLIATWALSGCGGGGGGSSDGSIIGDGGGGTVTGTTWYFAVRARDTAGNFGPYSNEVSGEIPAGSSATLVWTPPNTSVDGSCAYDVDQFEVAYGQTSGDLASSETTYVNELSCTISGTDQCGDVHTCEYTTAPLS